MVNASNCIQDDHPTVVALHVLLERVLDLPEHLTTPEQRSQWQAFQSILPEIPMTKEGDRTVVSPFGSYPVHSKLNNAETPELYSTHPWRYFTAGRSLTGAVDIAPSLFCLLNSTRASCKNAQENTGWTQGGLNAALLGEADMASQMALGRAATQPAAGYRFPVFAPHCQDYEPSADHFANLLSMVNLMLLQPADDGLANSSSVLFPAWPCDWDVEFKIRAPRNTTVEGRLSGGKLAGFKVTPSARAASVIVRPCQQ